MATNRLIILTMLPYRCSKCAYVIHVLSRFKDHHAKAHQRRAPSFFYCFSSRNNHRQQPISTGALNNYNNSNHDNNNYRRNNEVIRDNGNHYRYRHTERKKYRHGSAFRSSPIKKSITTNKTKPRYPNLEITCTIPDKIQLV